MGPIQILTVAFEDFAPTGIAEELESMSEAGTIRVIDARFLLSTEEGLVATRASDMTEHERAELRSAAAALVGLGAGAVLAGVEGAEAGAVLGAEAGWIGGSGLTPDEIGALGDELAPGEALLLLVIENVWAEGLRNAIAAAGAVDVDAAYVTPEGLVALGALLGVEAVGG